jgi:hypothetical protein
MRDTDVVPAITLEDFAPNRNTTCTVCNLPAEVRLQVERARAADPQRFTYPVISQWLGKHADSDVSDSSLRRHFKRGHNDGEHG